MNEIDISGRSSSSPAIYKDRLMVIKNIASLIVIVTEQRNINWPALGISREILAINLGRIIRAVNRWRDRESNNRNFRDVALEHRGVFPRTRGRAAPRVLSPFFLLSCVRCFRRVRLSTRARINRVRDNETQRNFPSGCPPDRFRAVDDGAYRGTISRARCLRYVLLSHSYYGVTCTLYSFEHAACTNTFADPR